MDTEGRPELTTGVDDTEVFPCARVTRISKFSGSGTNQAAFLPLTAGGKNLQGHRWLAVWRRRDSREIFQIRWGGSLCFIKIFRLQNGNWFYISLNHDTYQFQEIMWHHYYLWFKLLTYFIMGKWLAIPHVQTAIMKNAKIMSNIYYC